MQASPLPLIFLPTQKRELSIAERFRSKFVPSAGGCHIWKAGRDRDGYGWFNVPKTETAPKRLRRAHRVAYILFVGDLPQHLEIDHDCHTKDRTCIGGKTCPHRACVNPAHLVAVTGRVNTLLGRGITAREAQQTHCLRDHPLSGPEADVYIMPSSGGRQCRPCKALGARRRKAERAQVALSGAGHSEVRAMDRVLVPAQRIAFEQGALIFAANPGGES